jgi:hypothetical protein
MSFSTSVRLVSASVTLASFLLFSGCSSAPRSKGYDQFSHVTAEAHDYARSSQRKKDNDQFAKADAISEHIGASLADGGCFKILSSTFQWGLLEPEVVFKGEGQDGTQALIVVPPAFEDRERFPTPTEVAGIQVYRIDEDAPFGPKLVRMLESMLGRTDLCVSFTRAPVSEGRDTPVISATALPVSQRALASSKVSTPVSESKPEFKVEPKAEPKTDTGSKDLYKYAPCAQERRLEVLRFQVSPESDRALIAHLVGSQ